MKERKLNQFLFFIDSKHRTLDEKNDILSYEKRESGYFRAMNNAFKTHVDKVNPKHLSYEDFVNLHQGLTSHLTGVEMITERHFGLNFCTADEEGIREASSKLTGQDFLEAKILGDPCIYTIMANNQITRSVPCLVRN